MNHPALHKAIATWNREEHGEEGRKAIVAALRKLLGHTYDEVQANKQSGEFVRDWHQPQPLIDSIDSAWLHARAKGIELCLMEQDGKVCDANHGFAEEWQSHKSPARAAWLALLSAL